MQAAEKKLEALAGEISKLKKQRAQQEALLKARQASDQRVKQLEGEINHIKAQKAAISRRQREEADTHRSQRIAVGGTRASKPWHPCSHDSLAPVPSRPP